MDLLADVIDVVRAASAQGRRPCALDQRIRQRVWVVVCTRRRSVETQHATIPVKTPTQRPIADQICGLNRRSRTSSRDSEQANRRIDKSGRAKKFMSWSEGNSRTPRAARHQGKRSLPGSQPGQATRGTWQEGVPLRSSACTPRSARWRIQYSNTPQLSSLQRQHSRASSIAERRWADRQTTPTRSERPIIWQCRIRRSKKRDLISRYRSRKIKGNQ